jgi:hypothetical protein
MVLILILIYLTKKKKKKKSSVNYIYHELRNLIEACGGMARWPNEGGSVKRSISFMLSFLRCPPLRKGGFF